jgi:pilus assembly protein CpaF
MGRCHSLPPLVRQKNEGLRQVVGAMAAGKILQGVDLLTSQNRIHSDRRTILVSGGTDTGKTTFAKALLDFIPQTERLGVIEDTIELKIDHPNVFRFEARKEIRDFAGNVTTPAVTIRDLVKATLRHRPDRLIIGEVRGGEAFDLLDALNTGHAGSISTLHANSASQALSRLASLSLRADVDMPYRAIQAEIGDLINLVIHIERREDRRFVSQVLRIEGFDAEANRYNTTALYKA